MTGWAVGTAGARCCRLKLACHLLGTRDGLTHKTGDQCGPLYLRLASAASRELIRCGCKKGCTGHGKCKKAALKCTALCQCEHDN